MTIKKMGRIPRPLTPGSIKGEFKLLSQQPNSDLWNCQCTSPAGHKLLRPEHLLRASHVTKCPGCRRDEKLAAVKGKVYGKLKVIGFTDNSPSGHIVAIVKCTACGHESKAEARELRRGYKRLTGGRGITGRACPGCREKRMDVARANPVDLSPEIVAEMAAACRRGVGMTLAKEDSDRVEDDCVSQMFVEILQYPNIHEMSPRQLAATANRLGKRIALSTVKLVRVDDYRQVKPVLDNGKEHGQAVDLFADLDVPAKESDKSDELQKLALDSLSRDEREFMHTFLSTVGVKSKHDKQLFKSLTEKARAALGSILAEMGETPTESAGECGA